MRSFILLGFALSACAQSAAYTDGHSGITFQGHQDSDTGFQFGMTLPEKVGTDFVGNMVFPTNGTGYGGATLTGEMSGSLMIVAWPSGSDVVASLRETSAYASPAVFSNTSVTLSPIANGTFVNSTHLSYTFLCKGCIGLSYTFEASAAEATIGWALSSSTVTDPSSASGASFQYHNVGYGDFGLILTSANSANYARYAAMATTTATSNVTGSSNSTSTCTTSTANNTASVLNSTYDYIVAGAGPAGIIVAERLAESGKSVLLIERGADSTYASGGRSVVKWNETVTQYDVPSMSYYLTTASDTSEYCTDVAAMSGCILGGGTMVNALMFVRPQEADFNDKWPTGWKWSDVSTSAERLYERNPGTTLASKDGKRYDQAAWTILSDFLGNTMGWSHVDAIQSPNLKTKVYSYPPWDIQDGLRAGPVKSYYPLAKAMDNFSIKIQTKVVRVIRTNGTMSGVEVETSAGAREIINLNTNGKVILAAGALSTPRILFNSGIGPAAQIQTVKSGCTSVTLPAKSDWIDLPVGENLQDHPIFTLLFNVTGSDANLSSILPAGFTSPNATDIDLFAHASGPLAQSGQRLNFWTSLNSTNGTRFFQGTCSSSAAGTVRMKIYLTHGATSSGVLGIDSSGNTEFTTKPWMNTDADKTAVTTFFQQLLDAASKSDVVTYSDASATPSEMIKSYIQGDHFVGTARMGASNDGKSVVDTNTKVWGTDNLYVVDASIHADLPTGNSQAIVMVVAEKAAEKILAVDGLTVGEKVSGTSASRATASGTASGAATSGDTPGDDDDDDDCE